MKYEKAKEIICDAIFNGEYCATQEQEEAYFTIFHEGRKEPINEEELDRLATDALENKNPTKALNKIEAFDWGYKAGYRKAKEEQL